MLLDKSALHHTSNPCWLHLLCFNRLWESDGRLNQVGAHQPKNKLLWKIIAVVLGCNGSLPGCCIVFARVFWVATYYQPNHKPLWWFGPYIWLIVSLWDFFVLPGKHWLDEPHLSHGFLIALEALPTDGHPNIYCKNIFHYTSYHPALWLRVNV